MNLHEYQGKQLLQSYGVRVQQGKIAETADQAVEAAQKLQQETGTPLWVLKAQVHAGGRGKAGGVKVAKSLEEVYEKAKAMLGMKLISRQTGPQGKIVHKILIAQDVYYPGPQPIQEFYISILLNRSRSRNMIIYSSEGGVEIEEVAAASPDKIYKEEIDPKVGLCDFQCRKIAFRLGLKGEAFKEMVKLLYGLYRAYEECDASLIEINPLLKTSDDKILAVDAKVVLDDNALFRHPDLAAMRDIQEENEIEVEATSHHLNYIKLDGNVGCMVNGAGLAMATMDMIKLSGGEPANFLDVGGTANAQRVEAAFRIILKDPNVKAILVNIFGGIVRCDRVAEGIVEAYRKMGSIPVPIIVRLQGTNAEQAKKIIDQSGLKVQSAILLEEAAELVKKAVQT